MNDFATSEDKTEVVLFHKSCVKAADRGYVYKIGQQVVRFADQYKYLGLIFGNKGRLNRLVLDAAARGTRARGVVYKMFNNLGINSNVYLKLRLYKAVMLPNLTFGSEVWGAQLLQLDPAAPFDNPVDKVTTAFLRNLLGIRSSTSTWCLYREVGMYPLQLFCFRQMIRFINKLIDMPADTLARCVLYEMAWDIKNWGASNWLSTVLSFAHRIGVPLQLGDDAEGIVPVIAESECMTAARRYYHCLFTKPNAKSEMRRYHAKFAENLPFKGGKWSAADYTFMPLSANKSMMLARCRLGSHFLKSVTGGWCNPAVPHDERLCDLCGGGQVQDEHHVIFACPHFAADRHKLQPLLDACQHNRKSLWSLFNNPDAQPPLADFLSSTGLMVR